MSAEKKTKLTLVGKSQKPGKPKVTIPQLSILEEDGLSTLTNLASVMEYLNEIRVRSRLESDYSEEVMRPLVFGEWMLERTLIDILQHGLGQLEAERDENRQAANTVGAA